MFEFIDVFSLQYHILSVVLGQMKRNVYGHVLDNYILACESNINVKRC